MTNDIHSSACLAETGGPAVPPIVSAASDKALPSIQAGVQILVGDVRTRLRELPTAYFDCVMTSPPYWGLRDYGILGQIGLEASLGEHLDVMVDVFREVRRVLKQQGTLWLNYGDCYAAAPNGKSAAAYKADGSDDRTFRDKPFSTVGAIYDPSGGRSGGGVRGANKGNTGGTNAGRIVAVSPRGEFTSGDRQSRVEQGMRIAAGGMLKPKDLCMIPNRLAIALQDDGWYVRSEIIWNKPSAMPESIYDRPTSSHEKVWLLTKDEEYFYNHEAIREPVTGGAHSRNRGKETHGRHTLGDALPVAERRKVPAGWDVEPGHHGASNRNGRNSRYGKTAKHGSGIKNNDTFSEAVSEIVSDTRNSRNVWTIAAAAFDAEFCLECRSYFNGKAKRKLRVEEIKTEKGTERRRYCTCGRYDRWLSHFATFPPALAERCIKAGVPPTVCHFCGEAKTPETCGGICMGQERDRGRVLDLFGGAGTVGVVAKRLGLDCTLIELNPDYAAMAECRIAEEKGPA